MPRTRVYNFLFDPSSSVYPARVAVPGAEASPGSGIPKVEMWDVQERDGHFEVGTGRMRNPWKEEKEDEKEEEEEEEEEGEEEGEEEDEEEEEEEEVDDKNGEGRQNGKQKKKDGIH